MYTAILIVLIGISLLLLGNGLRDQQRGKITAGLLMGAGTAFLFGYMSFKGEQLWFAEVGYLPRFWTYAAGQGIGLLTGAFIGYVLMSLLTLSVRRENRLVRRFFLALSAFIGGSWGYTHWEDGLRFIHQASAGITDPIFNLDASFYLFTLPVLINLYTLAGMLSVLALVATFVAISVRVAGSGRIEFRQYPYVSYHVDARVYDSLFTSAGALLLVLAAGKFLDRYQLMFSQSGVVAGPGWTDVNVRLPALTIISALTALAGVAILIPPLRKRVLHETNRRFNRCNALPPVFTLGVTGGTILLVWFIGLYVLPGALQRLQVVPNEITFEQPYITHNIRFTRYGFGLNNVEIRDFPASETFTAQTVRNNPKLFSNIRLWDWRALDAVYKQFQEIRLYYEFEDVDVDRYRIGDDYRQVMVSAREMEVENLPPQSQTFVNTRFKYTHGFGVAMADVHEFTPQGLPSLLIKDLPPKSTHPSLAVKQPQIYYGERTNSYVLVNTKEEEFDYPRGEQNVYIQYPGKGGVPLNNFWRKFLYGWKFDGTRFLFSGYPTHESRIMFRRQIRERVETIAPFLRYDADPYIVVADGKLYWMMDAYTTSRHFPYSQPYNAQENIEYRQNNQRQVLQTRTAPELGGINYIRNSVKVVIDAFDGTVDFYLFDEKDPVARTYENAFPGLFKRRSQMPSGLQAHIRYPADMLLIQGLVYAKYHMNDPELFYNQEDLWIRATEKYYDAVQPVEPYYVMGQSPDADSLEYVLMLPFTPKNRQVLVGWIAGYCDPGSYGRFVAYRFPKQERVLGPQQVETKIDQDRFLSGQLNLWNQQGSNVIRGNVLAIPVDTTLLYVEPIYLQAQTAAYPELRLVVVMHNDNLSYANTFDEALRGLLGKSPSLAAITNADSTATQATSRPASGPMNALVERANEAFQNYLRLTGERKFEEASRALKTLEESLQQLRGTDSTSAGR